MNKSNRKPTTKQQKTDEYNNQSMTDYKSEPITRVHYVKKIKKVVQPNFDTLILYLFYMSDFRVSKVKVECEQIRQKLPRFFSFNWESIRPNVHRMGFKSQWELQLFGKPFL